MELIQQLAVTWLNIEREDVEHFVDNINEAIVNYATHFIPKTTLLKKPIIQLQTTCRSFYYLSKLEKRTSYDFTSTVNSEYHNT